MFRVSAGGRKMMSRFFPSRFPYDGPTGSGWLSSTAGLRPGICPRSGRAQTLYLLTAKQGGPLGGVGAGKAGTGSGAGHSPSSATFRPASPLQRPLTISIARKRQPAKSRINSNHTYAYNFRGFKADEFCCLVGPSSPEVPFLQMDCAWFTAARWRRPSLHWVRGKTRL
jgi:hypothetical protein